MRITLLILWLTVPLAFAAYHYGPGQDRLKKDDAAAFLKDARSTAPDDEAAAIEKLEGALAALPESAVAESRQIRFSLAKARMEGPDLPRGHDELASLLRELTADPTADQGLKNDTQSALATAKYYMTWLMRLEGLGEEEWMPEIEASRQHFRSLAEQAEKTGDAMVLATAKGNLENAIKLARMDLTDLEGQPLPKCCKCCKSGKCKSKSPPKNPQKPEDSRKAGSGPPPDGSGS